MKWIGIILLAAVLLGPLRRWIGRHWALLISIVFGAGAGFIAAAVLNAKCGGIYPFLPLIGILVGAIGAGQAGPAWLRHIEKDGRNGQSSRRH